MRAFRLALLAVVCVVGAVVAFRVHAEGVAPCLTAVAQQYQDCKADCRESFQLAKDTCVNRDHQCVESCRADRSTCLQPTLDTLNGDLATCASDLETAKGNCRSLYADGTPERDTCIDDAQVQAFQCRDAAREKARPGIVACRHGFKVCVRTNCPPTSAPDPSGVKACKQDARDLRDICVADCVEGRQNGKDLCLNRDHDCVEGCRATRDQCRAPFVAQRDGAIADCNATRDQAINDNCPPPGDEGRDGCVDQAQTVAFQCRDAARETVQSDLNGCRQDFIACAQACPPPPAP